MFASVADVALFVAAFVPTLIALFGNAFPTSSIYGSFSARIPGAPPAWLFGVVWGTLYPLISVAFYCVAADRPRSTWVILALVQFALLLAWPRIFSGALEFALALVVLLGAWAIAIYLAVTAHLVVAIVAHAALALWLTYAAYLNLMSIQFNGIVKRAAACKRNMDLETDTYCIQQAGGCFYD